MTAEVETPYTVSEVCKLMGLSRQTVIRIFSRERGVIVYERKEAPQACQLSDSQDSQARFQARSVKMDRAIKKSVYCICTVKRGIGEF